MEFQVPAINFLVALPMLLVAGTGILLMALDLFVSEERMLRLTPWVTVAGLILAFVQTVALWGYQGGTFEPVGGTPMLVVDNYATFLNIIFLVTGFLTVLISRNYLQRVELDRPEFYMLMLFSLSGMMLMGMANDLILVFLALELLSIPLYIMAGFAWPRLDSEESAMKYFLLGAFSSAVFVYGIALTYGATGTTALPVILESVTAEPGLLLLGGAAMMLVGFGFKIAAAPFHMWTPDVYEGAPTAVTAFMSVGAKVAGFAALLRVIAALPQLDAVWVPAIAALAALTLIVGNVVAIAQTNIKRMLGYSSIAHAGYILIAVAANSATGISAALFYMFAYVFTNMGAFAIVIAMERQLGKGVNLDDYKGLAKKAPWMALAMAFFMFSLTGIPPTGGFTAKYYVFGAAVDSGLIWLVVIGVLTSVVSGFYYLRVVYLMFMMDGEPEFETKPAVNLAVIITVIGTLLLGLWPALTIEAARDAVIMGAQALLMGG